MQAYDSKKDEYYCDLFCYICDGWENKPCLMSGTICMKMMMIQCLGLGKLLLDFKPIGKWARVHALFLDETNKSPTYALKGVKEVEH